MQPNKKRIGLIFLTLCIITGLFVLIYLNSRTLYNTDDVLGNSAGNLYNGGLFCESGDRIYFSNPLDNGTLYSMSLNCTDFKKLSDDTVCYLNADDHYIYYSRMNYTREDASASVFQLFNSGIYRINKTGRLRLKTLYSSPSGLLLLYGNNVYYQAFDRQDGLSFSRASIDGKTDELLRAEGLVPASIYNGSLYYAGVNYDHNLHIYDPSTGESTLLYEGNCFMPIAAESGIYFLSASDNYALCHVTYDGIKTILVDEQCSTYLISADERALYCQIDGENSRLLRLDPSTGLSTVLLTGHYKQLHLTSNYLFFRNFEETEQYAFALDGSNQLNSFRPPVLD